MNLFGKKKEEEEVVEEETISGRKISKNLTLTKKQTRKKKKEPPKPWGKKERYFVFWVLAITILLSGVLGMMAREWKLPGMPRIKVPTLKLFDSETIVIEGGKDIADEGLKDKETKIKTQFKNEVKDLSGVYGFYIVDLNSSYSFGLYEDEVFQAASLIKLPVMAGVFKLSEKGELDLDEVHILKNSEKVGGAGSLYSKPEGYEITYKNILELMGKQSDNTAFNISRNLLTDDGVEKVITSIGMEKTNLKNNETSPRDIGRLFEELYKGNILTNEDKDMLLDNMTDTLYESWIAEGIPDNVKVSHKFGREVNVVNDAGIIFSQRPFVLVILSKGVVEREADDVFPILSRMIYSVMAE